MAKPTTGNIARELASAPIIRPATETVASQTTMGAALTAALDHAETETVQAAIESSIQTAADTAKADTNVFLEMFGEPRFAMGDGRVFPDDKNPLKSSRKAAVMELDLHGLPLQAAIYVDTVKEARADGWYAQEFARVSLPRGFDTRRLSGVAALGAFENWRNLMLDRYDAWQSTVDAAKATMPAVGRGRLVKPAVKIDQPAV